jgi:hypothetical protein
VGLDAESLEDGVALRILNGGPEDDEIFCEEILEFGIFEKLLTEQYAAPSGVRHKIEENLFVCGLGLGHGFVQGAFEIDLGRSGGGQDEKNR